MGALADAVLTASAGRDRVVDAVKAAALVLVVVGHNLAWTSLPGGTVTTTLDVAPWTFPLTWVLEIIPLFFLLAGWGLPRLATRPATARFARGSRLLGPAIPLLLASAVLAVIVSMVSGPDLAAVGGVLTVQPLWFLGAYLLVLALTNVLVRVHHAWQFAVWLGLIAVVDWLRITVAEPIGWVNLVLIWSLFAAIGTHLDRLRALPRWIPALGLVGCAVTAATLIAVGPYSAALITTNALPGITNLAPPSTVLALAGIAQCCALLLLWPALSRLLHRDRVWVPVALLTSRAMELYLWHVFLMALMVAGVLALGWAPDPLSATWWALHLGILTLDAGVILLLAPALRTAGRLTTGWLAAAIPHRAALAAARGPLLAASLTLAAMGIATLLVSEGGVHQLFTPRTVIVLPYVAAAALLVIAAGTALCARVAATEVTRTDRDEDRDRKPMKD